MKINLKDIYPFIHTDYEIEVSDEVAECFAVSKRAEHAYDERTRYNRAYYSLDMNAGLDGHILYIAKSPEEVFERKLTIGQLYQAMNTLSKKQLSRIYSHYFIGMPLTKIAAIEGTAVSSIHRSIQAGMKNIKKYLENLD